MEDGVPLNEVPYAAENIVVPPGGESHLTHIDQQLVDPCSVKPPAAEPPAAPPAAEPPAAEPPATGAKAAVQEAAAGEEADASSAGAQKAASDPLVKAQDMQRRLAATREETIDLTRDHASTPLANRPPPTPLEEMKRNQSNCLHQLHLIPRGDGVQLENHPGPYPLAHKGGNERYLVPHSDSPDVKYNVYPLALGFPFDPSAFKSATGGCCVPLLLLRKATRLARGRDALSEDPTRKRTRGATDVPLGELARTWRPCV